MLPFALHVYHTIVKTSTGATSYSMAYGMEAIIPLKVEILSSILLIGSRLEEAK